MITIISPAKSMDFTSEVPANISATKIQFGPESESLLEILQSKTTLEIKKIMKVSDKIAELNYDRLQNFSNLPEREALFAYSGDVYNNMDKASFNTQDLNFAAQNLRIISGFYGILRPFDRIKPYRLEMVTKLPKLAKKGLSYYWQDIVSNNLNQEIIKHDSKNIINLASNEYSDVLLPKKISAKIINIHFREIRGGVIKNIALNAKRARGMMASFIIRNKIDKAEMVKDFQQNGYKYSQKDSTATDYMFILKTNEKLGFLRKNN